MSKNVVFIISVVHDSRSSEQGYDWSIKSWHYWCERNDVQLFVMDEPAFPIDEMKLTWQRYYLFDILDHNGVEYDQVCMVDADTIVHPDCPNFFELSDGKHCAVVNPVNEWVMKSMEIYSNAMFNNKMIPFWEYVNAGLQIVNKKHKEFFKSMVDFYNQNKDKLIEIQNTYGAGSDQTPLNFFIKIMNVDFKILSQKFNMQDMNRSDALTEDLLYTKMGWIYHFNTWPKPTPEWWMEKTYKELYNEIR